MQKFLAIDRLDDFGYFWEIYLKHYTLDLNQSIPFDWRTSMQLGSIASVTYRWIV